MSRTLARKAADPTTAYARSVVSGKVVTGRLVLLACERHLRDLKTGRRRKLWFDSAEAAAAIDFWEICPHLKGDRAQKREDIRLEPWQKFVIGSVYGWKRKDGRRRFKVSWVELARKNGKTTMVYPAVLHALVLDDEEGGEVYSVATKKDQARLVYDLARRAVARVPELAAIITPYVRSSSSWSGPSASSRPWEPTPTRSTA